MKNNYKQVIEIFKQVFPGYKFCLETNKLEIPDWDSLNHLNLTAKIEDRFEIKIPFEQMLELNSVGDFVDIVFKNKKKKKCIAVDLDDTLWLGVVGEVGPEGVIPRVEFQKKLKELRDSGVILVMLSRNNELDGLDVFKKNKDMVLSLSDFAAFEINWRSKAENLCKIAQYLNIGIDSFIFIDDSPIQLGLMRESLPEVLTFDAHDKDLFDKMLINFEFSDSLSYEDKNKTELYQQNAERIKALNESGEPAVEFLSKSDQVITIWEATEADVERISQLTQKSNQFNLVPIKYSNGQIKQLIKSKTHVVYIANVEDKFGDYGRTVLVVVDISANDAEIQMFLMSCRVMGRYVEDSVITFIEDKLRGKGFRNIKAEYVPTNKNVPVEYMYESLGYEFFLINNENGSKFYTFDLENGISERTIVGKIVEKEKKDGVIY